MTSSCICTELEISGYSQAVMLMSCSLVQHIENCYNGVADVG